MSKTNTTKKNQKKETTMKMPKVFSIVKNINPTDAVMKNVVIKSKGARGAQGHEGKTNNNGKNEYVGLFESDYAYATDENVVVTYDIKITPFYKDKVSQTDNVEFYKKFNEKIKELDEELLLNAKYIAYNILNGRWLWRNRGLAEDIKITVTKTPLNAKDNSEDEIIAENKNVLDWKENIVIKDDFDIDYEATGAEKESVEKLAKFIYKALKGSKENTLRIEAELKVPLLETMYPSQILPLQNKKTDKTREFYKAAIKINGENPPAINGDKVWNALRTYDVWYKGADGNPGYETLKEPLAIENTGVSIKFQARFREKEDSFFDLLLKFISDEELSKEELVYITACMLRGGAVTEKKSQD